MGWHTSHCSLVNTDPAVSLLPAYLSNGTEHDLIPDRYGPVCGQPQLSSAEQSGLSE